jgi:transcriptional regulator with XRE-family HTH domain
MSTNISPTSKDISTARYISLFGVNSRRRENEDLADYVQRVRREKGLSQRDVEAKSGGGISKGYIGQIENRDVLGQSVTPKKLQALARGLEEPEENVFAYARGLAQNGEPKEFEEEIAVMFHGWKDASPEDRQVTLEAIRMIAVGFQQRRRRKKK